MIFRYFSCYSNPYLFLNAVAETHGTKSQTAKPTSTSVSLVYHKINNKIKTEGTYFFQQKIINSNLIPICYYASWQKQTECKTLVSHTA